MAANYQKDIERVSEETLDVLAKVASAANLQLREPHSIGPASLASINTFTSGETVKTLSAIDGARRRSLEALTREPAIARVVARADDGELVTYYICRDQTPSGKFLQGTRLAARNAPVGRLASLDVGDELETFGLEVVEKAILRPHCRDRAWDSRDSILKGASYGPITIVSMREALAPPTVAEIGDAILSAILAEEEKAANVIRGVRRNVITKMGLRDQPILDFYQDEIFRLRLNSQLFIIGPPGTGKTTTLIRRLGQKLDREYLDEDERRLVEGGKVDSALPHASSWMMFTPTDLLKLYLKEAFARENIAAPDQNISTWSRYRLELARNRFRILRTPNGGGPFILKDSDSFVQQGVLNCQTAWYEDFSKWQDDDFWADIRAAAEFSQKPKTKKPGG